METQLNLMTPTFEQRQIFLIRGKQVMLASDVAKALGVETRQINENANQSPKWEDLRDDDNYRFQLTRDELENLRSKFSIFQDFKHLPWVYTQLGCNHFGTSLNSAEACELAKQLSSTFTAMQTMEVKIGRRRTKELTLGDKYVEGAKIIKSMVKASKLLGSSLSLARAESVHAVSRAYPEVDYRPLLAHNPATVQDKDATATDLGKSFDPKLSPQQVNKKLASLGLQFRSEEGWELTPKGREYGQYHNTGKKHSSGTTVQQIKWFKEKVVSLLNHC